MKLERAKELLESFRGKKVLVVGDVFLDAYQKLKTMPNRPNPEASVPLAMSVQPEYHTGGAGNVAKNLAALGASTVLCGVVGNDELGHLLETTAMEEGYNCALWRLPRKTGVKTRFYVDGRYTLRIDDEEVGPIYSWVERNVESVVIAAPYDGVIISDYAKGMVTAGVATMVLKALKSGRIGMGLGDMKPQNMRLVKGITMISPNYKEGRAAIHRPARGGLVETPEYIARELAKQYATQVYLTLSEQGVFISGEGMQELVPQGHQIQVHDTSGCGDTAAAVILLARLSGATPTEAAELANAAGAVVATKIGAVAPKPEEVLSMLGY